MSKRIWVERNKDGSWDAFSDDGAHIKFGKGRGQFTPGDLMKIALAGCAALSCAPCVRSSTSDATDADLSPEDVEKLKKRVRAHVDKGCTVKHTYEQVTPVRMDIEVRS